MGLQYEFNGALQYIPDTLQTLSFSLIKFYDATCTLCNNYFVSLNEEGSTVCISSTRNTQNTRIFSSV